MKKILFFQIVLCFSTVIKAHGGEEKKHDAGLWAYFSVAPKPVVERLNATFALEYRNKDNFSRTSLWCFAFNAYYQVNSWFKLGVGYEQFMNKQANGDYTPEYRYYPATLLSFGQGAFAGSFRSYLMNTFERWEEPHWELRNRMKMSYLLKGTRLKPFVAAEPYHAIDDFFLGKIRYYAGISYGFGKHQFDSYYLREVFQNKPLINNIIAVEYHAAF